MHIQYGIDDRPPLWKSLLLGLQWAAIVVPGVIMLGRALDSVQAPGGGPGYLQRLFLVTAVTLVAQVLWGHRLPVVAGPAAVLLVGVLSSGSATNATVSTSIAVGGLLLLIVAAAGWLRHLRQLFTDNIVAVVLLLIAWTLMPTVSKLLVGPADGARPLVNLSFAAVLLAAMFVAQRMLSGIWRSTVIVWAMLAGSPAYLVLVPTHTAPSELNSGRLSDLLTGWTLAPEFSIGVLLSFLVCYLALCVNDVSSIESVNRMLHVTDAERRVSRGIAVTGLANILSGVLGVVGPVNYSLSPGVIMSTGCASRFTLLPAAGVVGLLAFVPAASALVGRIPSVVIGCVLLYVLTSQVAAGLSVALAGCQGEQLSLETGTTIGLSVLAGTIIAFLPAETVATLPPALQAVVGNGFVVGMLAALLLEHGLFRK
jgi:xanthine/uracil permease